MDQNLNAARVVKPLPRFSISGFSLSSCFVKPLGAHTQGCSRQYLQLSFPTASEPRVGYGAP